MRLDAGMFGRKKARPFRSQKKLQSKKHVTCQGFDVFLQQRCFVVPDNTGNHGCQAIEMGRRL
jgi:hypothetical protein